MAMDRKKDFIVVDNVTKWYPQRKNINGIFNKSKNQWIKSVDGISFRLDEGDVLGVIGESGCGKSTLGRILVRLEESTSGEIFFNGVSASELIKKDLKEFRRTVQIIFQNPFDTFTPRHTIRKIMTRALKVHNIGASDEERYEMCKKILENAGLAPADDYLSRYPHELSGGQLQRISILRSMMLNPPFIVADEPVSMLDVSIRADIINMLLDLTQKHNTSMVFISHDIATTRYISNKVAVMYLGRIVEIGKTDDVLHSPLHPYTQALISNCASINPGEENQPIIIQGEPPTPVNAGPGCYFSARCFAASEKCYTRYPDMRDAGNGHLVSCHRV